MLTRRFVDFEADLEGTGEPPAAPADPGHGSEPAVPPSAASEPAGWTGPSRQEWEDSQAFQRAVLEALNTPDDQASSGPPSPRAMPEFQTAEEAYAFVENLANERAQALYQEQFGPYVPILDEFAKKQGEELVTSKLSEISGQLELGLGDASIKQAAMLAQTFFGQGVPADQAIRAAAEMQAAHDQEIRKQALAEQTERMQNRLDDGTQPPAGRGAEEVQQYSGVGRDRYAQIAEEWANRRAAARAESSGIG